MRDPKRIERILSLINKIWQEYPDMRFGQLIANVSTKHELNLFYTEDDELEEKLKAWKKRNLEIN